MTDDISLHSIDIDGEIYFIQVHFKAEYCCDILLTNVESTWKCDLLKSAIADFAKETDMDLQEYFLLLKAAFTGKSFQKVWKLILYLRSFVSYFILNLM